MATSFYNPQTLPIAVDPATGQPYLLDSADGRFTSQISGPAMSPTLARQYDEQLVQDALLRNQQAMIAQREAIVAEARAREAAAEAQRQREIAAAQAERDRLAAQPPATAADTAAGTPAATEAKPASPWQDPAFTGTKFASSFLPTQKSGEQTLGVQGFAALPFEERQKVVDAYVEQEVKARGMDPQRAAKFRDKANALTYQDTGGKEPDSGVVRGAADIGLATLQGGVGAVRSIAQLAGADNVVASSLKGVNDWLQDFKSTASQQEAANIERRIEQAKKSGSTTEELAAYLTAVKDQPAEMIAQGLGSLVTLGFGKAVQLVRGAQALKAGATAAQAAQAASTAGKVANVTAATAQGTGAVKGQSYETTFKEAKALGKSDAEAARLASEASEYSLANAPQQAAGAVLGAASGLFGVDRLAGLGLGQATARGLTGRTVTGALGEALPEAAAAAQNTLAANQAAIRAGVMDPSREFEGVAGSAAQDAVIGGTLGGTISAVAGPRPDTGADSTLPPAPAGQPAQPGTPPTPPTQPGAAPTTAAGQITQPGAGITPSGAEATTPAAPAGTLSFADVEARLPPGLLDEEVEVIRSTLAQAQPATQAEWEAALTQTVGENIKLQPLATPEPAQTTTVIASTPEGEVQPRQPQATPLPPAEVNPEQADAVSFLAAVDSGAAAPNPTRIRTVASRLGLSVPLNAAPAETVQRIRDAVAQNQQRTAGAAPAPAPAPAAAPAPIQTTPFNVDNLRAAQQQLQALQQGATPTTAAVQQAEAATANGSPDNAGAAPSGSLSNIMERTAQNTGEAMAAAAQNQVLSTAPVDPIKEAPLPQPVVAALEQGDLSTALDLVSQDPTQDALTRTLATRLRGVFGGYTRSIVSDDLGRTSSGPIIGSADVRGNSISLSRNGGLNYVTMMHEATHAAVEQGLRADEAVIQPRQLVAKRELQALFTALANNPSIPLSPRGRESVSEFVAEVMSDPNIQAVMKTIPWQKSDAWTSFKKSVLSLLGIEPTALGATIASVDWLFTAPNRLRIVDFSGTVGDQVQAVNPRAEAFTNVERLLNDIDNGTLPARPDMVAMMAQTLGVPVGASNPETLSNIRNALATIAQAEDAALTDPYSGWFEQVGTTNDADPELAALVQAADVDQQQQAAITSAQAALVTEGSTVDQQVTAETEAAMAASEQQVEATVNQILPDTLDALPLKRWPRKQGQTKADFLKVMKQLDSGNPLQKQAARAKLLDTANFAGNGAAALKAYDAINNTIQQMESMGLAKTKNCS